MNNFLKKIFSEQFMDELAERVADKLAKKHLTNEKNILFQQKHEKKPYIIDNGFVRIKDGWIPLELNGKQLVMRKDGSIKVRYYDSCGSNGYRFRQPSEILKSFEICYEDKPTSNISSSYSSGCGSSNVIYDRCGNPKPYFNSGCGSGPAWRSEC